nr:unnamed protein product [Digitaria exilis]
MEKEQQQQQQGGGDGGAAAAEADIERLPADILAHVLSLLPSFRDLSMYLKLRTGDDTTARFVHAAVNLRDLDIIILWSCRHVTEAGLVALVNKCRRLECINVGGMRVPPESFVSLLSISPALQIRSIPQILTAGLQVSS